MRKADHHYDKTEMRDMIEELSTLPKDGEETDPDASRIVLQVINKEKATLGGVA